MIHPTFSIPTGKILIKVTTEKENCYNLLAILVLVSILRDYFWDSRSSVKFRNTVIIASHISVFDM